MKQTPEHWLVSYPDDGNQTCYPIEDTSFWYQHRNGCITAAVEAAGFAKEFYDIGGGNGITAVALQRAGYEVTLVEPYATGIKNARERGIVRTVHTTLEEYEPEEEGNLAAIGFFDVMEHIADDVAFLKNINRLMAVDGQLILTVPAFSNLWSDNDVQLGHYRRYDLNQLATLLKKCGFETNYSTYFFSLVWIPMWLMRVLPGRLGFRPSPGSGRKRQEHFSGQPVLAAFLRKILRWEIRYIRNKKKISFGTSCLVVATKVDTI